MIKCTPIKNTNELPRTTDLPSHHKLPRQRHHIGIECESTYIVLKQPRLREPHL
ncbi:hypothetical protein RHMOL_Rhmol01G0240900 [Rhododendron molle]|uniref:Uncharacterized protein n=1 Tax=Rhododendron molle TaxID=49168 RepID=A0ACC0Q6Q3_RHOML|nr:hypothetical protein RHMOL_Rhmol01G0240900 [Rhododendron molle]